MGTMKDDGGPAFPGDSPEVLIPPECTHGKQIRVPMNGMSLRDWFAGMALMAFTPPPFAPDDQSIAKEAYRLADAMLEARKK